MRDAIQGNQALLREMFLQKNDRTPGTNAPAPVDFVATRIDLIFEILILADTRTTRHADLHEDQTLPVLRILRQQAIQGAESLENSLGVVDAVDAHTHKVPITQAEF